MTDRLEVQPLVERAQRETGLGDWGEPGFLRHLAVLLQALNTEAALHPVGRERIEHRLLLLMRARLHLVEDRRRSPGIAAERIEQPLIVVGLPRSGTTFLHKLLASDPAHRSPMAWEILLPTPACAAGAGGDEARIAQAQAAFEREGFLKPEVLACHPWDARVAEECNMIWEHSMLSVDFLAWWNVPTYAHYLMQQDFAGVYAQEKQFLQHLQHGQPGRRWVLKTPAHLLWLEQMFQAFPDACLVMCHRDPVKAIASLSDLLREMRGLFSHEVPLGDFGMIEMNARGMNLGTAFREARPEYAKRFIDVHFLEVQQDPMGTVRRIYDHFGFDLGAQREAVMREALARDREQHGRTGRHRYSADSVGLDMDRMREHWTPYIERYRVQKEGWS